jgi:hypothetical protein
VTQAASVVASHSTSSNSVGAMPGLFNRLYHREFFFEKRGQGVENPGAEPLPFCSHAAFIALTKPTSFLGRLHNRAKEALRFLRRCNEKPCQCGLIFSHPIGDDFGDRLGKCVDVDFLDQVMDSSDFVRVRKVPKNGDS